MIYKIFIGIIEMLRIVLVAGLVIAIGYLIVLDLEEKLYPTVIEEFDNPLPKESIFYRK